MSLLKNRILFFLFVLLLIFPKRQSAQDLLIREKNLGFNIGVNFAVGSHFQRLGLNVNFFYVTDFFQANSEVRAYFNFKNLGPKLVYPELVLSQGVLFGYGKKQIWNNPFITSVSNQTGYAYSVAYSYNAYFNSIKTKQQTGIIALGFDRIAFIAENDILGHKFFDRFRTGGFLLQYQYEDKFQAGISSVMWTGELGRKVSNDPVFKARCYMDTTGGHYTNFSHGLLSLQFKYNIGLSHNLQANLGVDAEQVRNAIQNKFIHDLPFVPKKLIKPINCHIPMLDTEGNQYLFRPEQKIKRPELFWNVFSNAALFY